MAMRGNRFNELGQNPVVVLILKIKYSSVEFSRGDREFHARAFDQAFTAFQHQNRLAVAILIPDKLGRFSPTSENRAFLMATRYHKRIEKNRGHGLKGDIGFNLIAIRALYS